MYLKEKEIKKLSICRFNQVKRNIYQWKYDAQNVSSILYGFVRWTNCIWWAIENNYLLVYILFEFAIEWIPAIRNKTELSSVQKITCIIAIADKTCKYILCLDLFLLVKSNSFFSLALFSPGIQNGREKKANQQLYVN